MAAEWFEQLFGAEEPYEFQEVDGTKALYNSKLQLWETIEQWQQCAAGGEDKILQCLPGKAIDLSILGGRQDTFGRSEG